MGCHESHTLSKHNISSRRPSSTTHARDKPKKGQLTQSSMLAITLEMKEIEITPILQTVTKN